MMLTTVFDFTLSVTLVLMPRSSIPYLMDSSSLSEKIVSFSDFVFPLRLRVMQDWRSAGLEVMAGRVKAVWWVMRREQWSAGAVARWVSCPCPPPVRSSCWSTWWSARSASSVNRAPTSPACPLASIVPAQTVCASTYASRSLRVAWASPVLSAPKLWLCPMSVPSWMMELCLSDLRSSSCAAFWLLIQTLAGVPHQTAG